MASGRTRCHGKRLPWRAGEPAPGPASLAPRGARAVAHRHADPPRRSPHSVPRTHGRAGVRCVPAARPQGV